MSVTGKYENDVFVSYAWGFGRSQNTALRDWSRKVTDNVTAMLRVRFGDDLSVFLDRDRNNNTAAALDSRFQDAAESSAVFVALVSTYYLNSYCRKELDWFLDKIAAEGSPAADRLCIFLIQSVEEEHWPERLREPSGKRLLYRTFHCPEGQPLDIAAFLNGAPTPALTQPTDQAALEIGRKLLAIKGNAEARTTYKSSQRPPDAPIMFLEAEPDDLSNWEKRRNELKEAANIILPARAPIPATEVSDPGDIYNGCDGLVLLRSRTDDNIGRRLKQAYLDRRRLKTEIPWALLDEQEPAPPDGEAFGIPRVVPVGPWVEELRRKLHGA